jgi:hypothetical protein
MKTLTPLIAQHILELGTEPVNILEVQWVKDGPFLKYGDKSIQQVIPIDGVILDLSNLEAVIKLDNEGQSESISVTLDDTSGDIKEIINYNDIHGKTVKLMQWFEGLPLSEAFQLYEGEISSPIKWSEGDRTISFSVISKLADKEVGFSPEEADFPFLPDELVGKAWPMAFGIVQNVPTVRLQEVPITQSSEDFGREDPTLQPNISSLDQSRTDYINLLTFYQLAIVQAQHNASGAATEEARSYWEGVVDQLAGYIGQLTSLINRMGSDLSNLRIVQDAQQEATNKTLGLIDITGFPTGPITLKIDGIELSGIISGNIFNISSVVDTNYDGTIDTPYGFKYIAAGTTVTLKTDKQIMYICNIIDSDIKNVQCFRQIENGQALVTVPSAWYTVRKITSGPYTFTLLDLPMSLSSRDNTLGDDIYVTMESTIGPNTVDIMIWLIETYTDLSWDKTSFDYVKVKLENYPSHFAMLDRRNIYTFLEEIAFQARCSIWIRNGVFYLKYLSEELTPNDIFTEDDIDAGSLIMDATQTEELVTVLTAEWSDNYAIEDKNKIILRHNVIKYGTLERTIEFYIYNLPELVLKSATFWLIRLANIWKIITFNTYVSKLAIETFDTINISLQSNHIANTDINCFVTDVIYDTSNHLLNLTCWAPVRFGEMTQYNFGWPSQILPELEFPTKIDIIEQYAGGAGPGVDVDGEFALSDEDKVLLGGQLHLGLQSIQGERRDHGERTPSDLDDVKPVPNFVGTDFSPGEEPDYDYDYDTYPFEPEEPDAPPEFEGAVYPGIVRSRIINNELPSPTKQYNVHVYENGLSASPLIKHVIQLQSLDVEDIPNGTWVLVAKNEPADENSPFINFSDGFEWSMQVPIWL